MNQLVEKYYFQYDAKPGYQKNISHSIMHVHNPKLSKRFLVPTKTITPFPPPPVNLRVCEPPSRQNKYELTASLLSLPVKALVKIVFLRSFNLRQVKNMHACMTLYHLHFKINHTCSEEE